MTTKARILKHEAVEAEHCEFYPGEIFITLKPGYEWSEQCSFGVETLAEAWRMLQGVEKVTHKNPAPKENKHVLILRNSGDPLPIGYWGRSADGKRETTVATAQDAILFSSAKAAKDYAKRAGLGSGWRYAILAGEPLRLARVGAAERKERTITGRKNPAPRKFGKRKASHVAFKKSAQPDQKRVGRKFGKRKTAVKAVTANRNPAPVTTWAVIRAFDKAGKKHYYTGGGSFDSDAKNAARYESHNAAERVLDKIEDTIPRHRLPKVDVVLMALKRTAY
jgi:hypothetical protein